MPIRGLDPDVTYLNHGTVGVVPLAVLEAQQALRIEIERRPSQFLLREVAKLPGLTAWPYEPRLRTAASAVAEFLGARGDDLVFVDNASSGANAVLSARSGSSPTTRFWSPTMATAASRSPRDTWREKLGR